MLSELLAPVWEAEVNSSACRDDRVGIQGGMRGEVVHLDVPHVNRLAHAWCLIDVPAICQESGVVVLDGPLVRLEVDDVDLVKADEGHEEPKIHPSELAASDVALLRQNRFCLVQVLKEALHCLIISLLRLGKATSVDAIVDVMVDPLVGSLGSVCQVSREEVEVSRLCPLLELAVEHLEDFGRLVVDNDALLLVPEHWGRVLA
mmetsp:Transcript_4782/g.10540  ORF Transcript_4782/g.10540 Transcript_4782/m.10540 type:complete len:204 (+) Transcript_4782:51-662(+)